jgi:hypothetical protein
LLGGPTTIRSRECIVAVVPVASTFHMAIAALYRRWPVTRYREVFSVGDLVARGCHPLMPFDYPAPLPPLIEDIKDIRGTRSTRSARARARGTPPARRAG